jgi:hypothetical protein
MPSRILNLGSMELYFQRNRSQFRACRRSGNSLRENPEFVKVDVQLDPIFGLHTYNFQE